MLIGKPTLNKMRSQIGDGSHDNQHALAYYEYRTSFQGSQGVFRETAEKSRSLK